MHKSDLLEKIEKLPDDPDQAFIEFAKILRGGNLGKSDSGFDDFALKFIVGFANKYNISLPDGNAQHSIKQYLVIITNFAKDYELKNEVDVIIEKYEDKRFDSNFGFAVLNKDEKNSIMNKLNEIKNIIVSSNVKENKKSSLIRKISNLEIEVNSDKTSTEQFFGFLTDLAFVAGEMANNAQPAIDEFKDILRIVMRSRAKNEGLPSPDHWPQLPGPEEFE